MLSDSFISCSTVLLTGLNLNLSVAGHRAKPSIRPHV